MKTHKKCYQTYKFWITSMLALSSTSIFASFALVSCTVNNNEDITSDVVINDQPNDSQEVSSDKEDGLTLSIDAKSTQGKELKFQWYQDKGDGKGWVAIENATSNSYKIPSSELKEVSTSSTWKYRAEIKYNDGSDKKFTSKTYSVNVKPASSDDSTPDPIPPTDPEEPKPDNPSTPDPDPENPNPPTPSPTPPTNPNPPNNDNPTIIPPPAHIPSKGIGARLPTDSTGLTTVKHSTEKYIGDNSISIAILAKPKVENIRKIVNEYTESLFPSTSVGGGSASVNSLLNSMVSEISNQWFNYSQFGTGWILDYSNSTSNSNLVNYYIATNMHVLSSYFTASYLGTLYLQNGVSMTVDVSARIPFNKDTVSSLDVYISQPQYDESSYKNNLNTYINNFNNQWYKTNINIDNFSSSLIPMGAYETSDNLKSSNPYDLELEWKERENDSNNTQYSGKYYFSSSDKGWLKSKAVLNENINAKEVDDFSILKLSMNKNTLNSLSNIDSKYNTMIQKMSAMFNVDTNNSSTTKNSSYISKLNKLISLTEETSTFNSNKETINELFMFSDEKDLRNNSTILSVAGYPVLNSGTDQNPKFYSTFNSNTTSVAGNNIFDYPSRNYHTRNEVGINQYTYDGKLYKLNWRGPHNYLLKNINLLAGSSGSMVVDQNNKISSINWGLYNHKEMINGKYYFMQCLSITSLYSKNDKSSIVWKWIRYIENKDSNSQLAKLFNNLEKNKYFNS